MGFSRGTRKHLYGEKVVKKGISFDGGGENGQSTSLRDGRGGVGREFGSSRSAPGCGIPDSTKRERYEDLRLDE